MGPAIALVGLGLAAVGIAGQVVSGLKGAESEAVAAESVAGFQEVEARSVEEAAAAEEAADRRRTARALGKLRAQGAATGVDPSSGSLLLLELDSAKEAELSALNIRQRGALRAFEKRVGAKLSRQRAEIARGRKGGIIAGGIFRGGSLLAGFAGGGGFGGGGGGGGGGTTGSALAQAARPAGG